MQHRDVSVSQAHAVGHRTSIPGLEMEIWVPDVPEPCLHAAALAPPFPTRFIECREFYEALPEPVSHRSPGRHTPSITAAFPQQN